MKILRAMLSLMTVAFCSFEALIPSAFASEISVQGLIPKSYTVLASDIAFVILLVIMMVLCFVLRDDSITHSGKKSFLALVVGVIVGWVLSIMWVPTPPLINKYMGKLAQR